MSAVAMRLLLTVLLVAGAALLHAAGGWVMRRTARGRPLRAGGARARFWANQALHLLILGMVAWGLLSLWFRGDGGRLATVAGLATAGIAVALQRVFTAFAGYLIVLRGGIYTIGDRITIAGVRGDVVRVGFMQTTVFEMGLPPSTQDDPHVWITGRQYTGRIVSVTNDRIFDAPVYNYTREFPYLWEEISVPVRYSADRGRAEAILLDAARRHTADVVSRARPAMLALESRYLLQDDTSLEPRLFVRITDNWVELAVRFLGPVRGIRALKDAMSREIIDAFAAAGLEVASATYEIVGLPPITLNEQPERR